MSKKIPLSFDEHKKLAKDLRSCQDILEPWVGRFYKCYGVKSPEVMELKKVLNLLSSKICCSQDNAWYELQKYTFKDDENWGKDSPYYGKGKIAWS